MFFILMIICADIKEAQTFAIRFTVHHKPLLYMGNLRPYGYSPNKRSFARCVAVVIVKLLSNMSCTLCGMRLQNYKKVFKLRPRRCKNC